MLKWRSFAFLATLLTFGMAGMGFPISPAVSAAVPEKGAFDVEADQTDKEMLAFEIAKSEYDAWLKLKIVHKLFADAKKQESHKEQERLVARAIERAEEILESYDGTAAVADAKAFIGGKQPPLRAAPAKPSLPKNVRANENEFPRESYVRGQIKPGSETRFKSPSNAIPSGYGEISKITGRPKTVLVRSYFRQDGTFVRSHWRSPPLLS